MEKDVFLGHLPKNKHLKNLLQTAITESNQDFYPPLIPRIDIHNYVDKITDFLRLETATNPHIVKNSQNIYFGLDCIMSYTKKK